MQTSPLPPNHRPLTSFDDFGSYLAHIVSGKRQARQRYNQSQLGKFLGIRSTALMSMIMSGSRMPSRALLRTMAKKLSWTEDEVLHAYLLCDRSKDEKSSDPLQFSAPIDRSVQVKVASTSKTYQPLVPLLAELSRVGVDVGDIEAVRRRAREQLTTQDVEAGLGALVDMGILTRDAGGRYGRNVEGSCDMGAEYGNAAMRRYHQVMMTRASNAIDELPPDERLATGMTIAISPEDFPKVVKMAHDFFRKVSRLAAQSEASEVFHVAVQTFPMTHIRKGDEDNA